MSHSRNYGDYSLKKDKCISVDVRQFGKAPNCLTYTIIRFSFFNE